MKFVCWIGHDELIRLVSVHTDAVDTAASSTVYDGSVQDYCNSIANALELQESRPAL